MCLQLQFAVTVDSNRVGLHVVSCFHLTISIDWCICLYFHVYNSRSLAKLLVHTVHVHFNSECISILVQSDVITVQTSNSGDETTSMNTAHPALVEFPKADMLVI